MAPAFAGASWIFGILLMLKIGRLKILSVNVDALLIECVETLDRQPK